MLRQGNYIAYMKNDMLLWVMHEHIIILSTKCPVIIKNIL